MRFFASHLVFTRCWSILGVWKYFAAQLCGGELILDRIKTHFTSFQFPNCMNICMRLFTQTSTCTWKILLPWESYYIYIHIYTYIYTYVHTYKNERIHQPLVQEPNWLLIQVYHDGDQLLCFLNLSLDHMSHFSPVQRSTITFIYQCNDNDRLHFYICTGCSGIFFLCPTATQPPAFR